MLHAWLQGHFPLVPAGGIPFICGGLFYDDCYKYEPALDEWISSGTLSEDKAYSGYGSSESWGLVMAGGSSTVRLSSVFTTSDGETFGSLPGVLLYSYFREAPKPYPNHDLGFETSKLFTVLKLLLSLSLTLNVY